ncbi:aminoacetone oxidase family FAD-binding enzyme [Pollutimonas thiosulfatoxidans]|uniref:Aminoacetone oxidase family FAD-binding enzyme n=2 Tax=Pollutimonas thiosulfatoxidans TaxID=2028345 RepID=A0A410GGH9_9BURK|nr:NAD(P)/FAD-dependent oxidoreductase [Pollutimonas thiosulfatoxidans]QAA95388.1 aminoacetone oxidase family FAD-binding enzyme [Pollutimonas thiosulfatoxidans]
MFDVAVIGAGAAGMMAAALAGQRGLHVVLIDHAAKLAEKIRISGGGRCNFTNIGTTPANFISQNPNFCRSALAAYTPRDFIDLVERHGIAWHEKHRGQLFCDESSEQIIEMLRCECDRGRVTWRMPHTVDSVALEQGSYVLHSGQGKITARQLVLATGGMAIPQLGATDFSLKVARQFGLKVVEPRPALVPLTFDAQAWQPFAALSGVAMEVVVRSGGASAQAPSAAGKGKAKQTEFLEDLLFTHRGLSGPAILQISSYWEPGTPLSIDLAPQQDLEPELLAAKVGSRQQLGTVLSGLWPRRLAEQWLANVEPGGQNLAAQRLADVPDKVLRQLAQQIHRWSLTPNGTAGYKKAEVMRGGVDTRNLDQKTMQVKAVPGLYIVGEAVDVTGWLGGYNFQWAWASGAACGRALTAA